MYSKKLQLSIAWSLLATLLVLKSHAQAVFQNNNAKIVVTGKPYLVLHGVDLDNQGDINGTFNLKMTGHRDLEINSLERIKFSAITIANRGYTVSIDNNLDVMDSIRLRKAHLNLRNSYINFSTNNNGDLDGESVESQVSSSEKGFITGLFEFMGPIGFDAGKLGVFSRSVPTREQVQVLRGHFPLRNDLFRGIKRWFQIGRPGPETTRMPSISLHLWYKEYELNGLDENTLEAWALDQISGNWVRCKIVDRDPLNNRVFIEEVPLPAYITLGKSAPGSSVADQVSHKVSGPKTTATLSAYPNPTADLLNIQIQAARGDEMSILECLDLSGRLVFSEKIVLHAGENRLEKSLAGLSNGVYLIRVAGMPESGIRIVKQ
jgi:Secretion system C-terminal sorting domain